MKESNWTMHMQQTNVSTYRPTKQALAKRLRSYIPTAAVVLLGLLVLFPIFWMVRTSLMSNFEINVYPPKLFPSELRFSNYPKALETFKFFRYFANTLTITVPSVLGAIVSSTLAAYALARLNFPLKRFWFGLIVGSMLMPWVVTLIPIFLAWSSIGLVGTYLPLITPSVLSGSPAGPFNIFLVRQFMMTIPRELDEAAVIDGATHMQILVHILIHMIRPALIAVGLFTFVLLWNDLLGPVIYISDQTRYTISQALATFRGGFGTNWKSLMAASTMSVLPGVILFFVGQKYFIEGIVLTGLKS